MSFLHQKKKKSFFVSVLGVAVKKLVCRRFKFLSHKILIQNIFFIKGGPFANLTFWTKFFFFKIDKNAGKFILDERWG